MAQIFHPSFNTLSKVSVVAAVLLAGGAGLAALQIAKGPLVTQIDDSIQQPVPFSHKHHVAGLGFDCRNCHTTVEDSSFAGLPPTKTCMSCHSQVWKDAPLLEPVRESFRTDEPIDWVRVHDLPEFVYFQHGVHVKKGVGCEECHGRVDQMPLMRRQNPLTMSWCLDCHRDPAPRLRPRGAVTEMGWRDAFEAAATARYHEEAEERFPNDPVGREEEIAKIHGQVAFELQGLQTALMNEYGVEKLTHCSVCHR